MRKLQSQGVHHITIVGAGRQVSIDFGLLIELAAYRFEPPAACTHTDVLLEAHKLRVARGDRNIAQIHLADAIEALVARSQSSLSDDRSPKNPYQREVGPGHGPGHGLG